MAAAPCGSGRGKGGRIVFVGSNAEAAKKFPAASGSRRIDLQGRTVVPGMTDAHCHIFGIGAREMNLNLEGTTSLEDFLAKVKERVQEHRPASGSRAGVGSRLSGNHRSFQRAWTWIKYRRTIRFFLHAPMVMAWSPTARR